MENFNWKISKTDRGTSWGMIIAMSLIALVVATYLLFTGNYFGGALFVVAPIVMFIVSKSGQKDFSCEITRDAIKANNNLYPFQKLSFFAIIADSLIIKPKKQNVIYLPIYIEDTEKIREILAPQLKEKDYEENFAEIINRFLRIN